MNPAGDPLEFDCLQGAQNLVRTIWGAAGCWGTHSSRPLKVPSVQVLLQDKGGLASGEGCTLLPYSCIAFWNCPRFIMYTRRARISGLVSMSRVVRNGLPYVILKGLNSVVVLGAALILKRAIGGRRYHNSDVS